MIDNVSDIRNLYNNNVEREDSRLERHPIERDVTWKYLDAYLPASGKILEIGAATGAYTIPLAQKGYSVTATDLSADELDLCRRRVIEKNLQDRVSCMVTDARDLSEITETGFDAVLIMGPLYHLVYEEDRIAALEGVFAKLKPGGVIFSAFISRFGIWASQMAKYPEYVEFTRDIDSILTEGCDPAYSEWGGNFRAYFTTVPEITTLHEGIGFSTLVVGGVEPVGIIDETYKNLTENQRRLWLDLMFRISSEPSIVGASCHVLYVGRKPE